MPLAPNTLPTSDAAPKAGADRENLPPGKTVEVPDDDKVIKFNSEGFLGEVETRDEEEDEEETKVEGKETEKKEEKKDDKAPETKSEEGKETVPPKEEKKSTDNEPPKLEIPTKLAENKVDTEGLTEVDQRYLKQSSKEAREYFAARIKGERKALEDLKALQTENVNLKNTADGKLPQNYLEHPEAFIFSPKFKEAQATLEHERYRMNHWENQLAKIAKGEKFNDLNYNEETGKYSLGVEIEPSVEMERKISKLVRQGELTVNEQQKLIQGIAAEHKNQHQSYIKQFRSLEDQYFPHYNKDDKTEGEAGKYIGSSRKLIDSLGQQHNPLAGMLTKLYAALMESQNHNKSMAAELQKFKQLPDKRALGPNSSDINSGGSGKAGGAEALTGADDEKVSMKMFDKYLDR